MMNSTIPTGWRNAGLACLASLLLLVLLWPIGVRAAEPAALELQVHAGGQPIRLKQSGQLADQRGRAISVTRLDLLLTQFSLQRPDGSWTAANDWHGFFKAEQPGRRQTLPEIAEGEYIGLRFSVGVSPQANHADPNRLPPDDPLHPVVNGMHWGWKGGYVFMALEGHWLPDGAPAGSTGGFSYHLGSNENLVSVRLTNRLRIRTGSVLRLNLDAARLLSGIDISRDGDSTHSRQPDAVVRQLKHALPRAFTLNMNPVLPVASDAKAPVRSVPQNLRAYPLMIDAHMPSVSLPADNPLTIEGVSLGEQLFNDRRLSVDNSVSCASCHRRGDAFSDAGRVLSTGVRGQQSARNAMPIFNLAWVGEFFWDARVDSLRRQALEPIQHPHEMAETLPAVVLKLSKDRQMADRFRRAFGGPVSAPRIGLALEQYMLSLVSQDSKFDRVKKGLDQFSPAEKRGLDLFLTEHDPANGLFGADCFHCHGGSLFTNHRVVNNGLPIRGGDTGRERVTGDPADRGKFRTPSLRNIAITGPYMHDGRFKTLEEVIDHYDRGIERSPSLDPNIAKHPRQGLRLSPQDRAALVAFLMTLTDPAFVGQDNLRAARNCSVVRCGPLTLN